jgi:hypothetical protein
MERKRESKKSESLEVRLAHEVKDALMRKARSEGRSASEIVRHSIDAYLADEAKEKPKMLITAWKPIAVAGAAAGALLWTAFAAAPVAAGPDFKAAFERLDQSHDQVVSLNEFVAGNRDMLFVERADKPSTNGAAKPFILPLRHELPAPPPGLNRPPADMLRSHYAELDANHDGQLSFDEFERFHERMLHSGFAAVDANADGSLDRAVFEDAVSAAPGHAAAASFADVDKDRDGRISEEEFFG